MTDEYTTSQIAKRLGVSTGHIRNQIGKGLLTSHGTGHRHLLWRSDVCRWLISVNWPAEEIRRLFPLPGPLAIVGLRPEMMGAVVMERPQRFDVLFDLAVSLAEVRPWGIVFDLVTLGPSATSREIAQFSKGADRPILIGLSTDEGADVTVFDVLIPGGLPVGKIAQRIRAVRPWGK